MATKKKTVHLIGTDTQRTAAKLGMAVSLGTLVATALMDSDKVPNLKQVHMCTGVALVGFSLWHYSLYKKTPGGA